VRNKVRLARCKLAIVRRKS